MSQRLIVLPTDRLPASFAARHALLRDYFCDKDATAMLASSGWELTFGWSDDEARHVDPRLDQGLKWWDAAITRSGMALARRRTGRILHVLYDSWTLHSWSEWFTRQTPSRAGSVVILHVDDHRDLASPRLFRDQDTWRDPLTDERFALTNANSVASAIKSGAVGMGSFMTPFIHAVRTAEVRHLCQPPKAAGTLDFKMDIAEELDTLLESGARRPAVRLQTHSGTGPGLYRITPEVDAWLENIDSRPILLHVDMDYFNNRYDGDSDWSQREGRLDPPLETILAKIDELVGALRKHRLDARVEDIVIAYSPGFFPAEHWSTAVDHLASGLTQLDAR